MSRANRNPDDGPPLGDEDLVDQNPATPENDPENMPNGQADHANYVSKITIANIGGNPSLAKAEERRVGVCRIGGICTAIKPVENQMDPDLPWMALQGQFFAINTQKNTLWRSGIAYLPAGFHEEIMEGLQKQIERRKLAEDDPDRRSKYEPAQVEFDLLIDAKPSTNLAGYSYVAKSLTPVAKADPLLQMIERGQKVMAALPPPAERN